MLVNAHGADPTYGGAERYVRDLALGLPARGHEVTIVSAFPPREEIGVHTHVLHGSDWRDDPLRRLRNHAGDVISAPWPRLRSVLAEARPDLVHTSNLPGIGSGIWEIARRIRIPVVHTLHDYYLLCPRTSLTRRDGRRCRPSPFLCGVRTRRLARWADGVDRVIAGSEHLLGMHRELFSSVPMEVIRLPLAPIDGARPGPPHSPPAALGYIGALTAIKGVALLLSAAEELADAGIELRVAGEGPLRDEVVAAGVSYHGRVGGSAKSDFLTACDVGVVPSLWEEPSGPPYVVCEWLAAGRPVLTTRRGGLGEATGAGVLGFDASRAGLLDAAVVLRDGEEWRRVLATVPVVDDDADVGRWLDEHEAAYAGAVERAAGRSHP